jgi:hypothetical protein
MIFTTGMLLKGDFDAMFLTIIPDPTFSILFPGSKRHRNKKFEEL